MLLQSTVRANSSATADRFLKPLTLGAASAGSVALVRGASLVTDRVLLTAESLLPTPTAPALPLSAPLEALLRSSGQVGLAGAVIGGAGIAAGAIWGNARIDLQSKPWWKKLLFQPAASLYNSGIAYRESMSEARQADSAGTRFSGGAAAGYRVGSQLGRGVGSVQGALLGGLAGWRLSGQALAMVEPLLQGAQLPPFARNALPFVVGVACVAAGQTLGSAAGSVVGGVTAGAALGAASGLYTASFPASS